MLISPGSPSACINSKIRFNCSRERSEERRVGKECRCRGSRGQAEDGIRDRNVTGVQTCALPIFNELHEVYRRQVTYAITIEKYLRAGIKPLGVRTSPIRLFHVN